MIDRYICLVVIRALGIECLMIFHQVVSITLCLLSRVPAGSLLRIGTFLQSHADARCSRQKNPLIRSACFFHMSLCSVMHVRLNRITLDLKRPLLWGEAAFFRSNDGLFDCIYTISFNVFNSRMCSTSLGISVAWGLYQITCQPALRPP